RVAGSAEQMRQVEITHGAKGTQWVTVGLTITAVLLLLTLVWTMVALAKGAAPSTPTAMTIDVTGMQWWWKVRYEAAEPDQTFITANEIHIPVGTPVSVRLHGGDVIHSFWVPKLSGKTDTIPGQTNVTWLQASQPGRYRGQCTEY